MLSTSAVFKLPVWMKRVPFCGGHILANGFFLGSDAGFIHNCGTVRQLLNFSVSLFLFVQKRDNSTYLVVCLWGLIVHMCSLEVCLAYIKYHVYDAYSP